MWKIIFGSFLVLLVGFYILSGGANFTPEQKVIKSSSPLGLYDLDTDLLEQRATEAAIRDALPTVDPLEAVIAASNVQPAAGQGAEKWQVNAARVNMRAGPSTDFEIVAKLNQGEVVEILSETGGGWAELRVIKSGDLGWMAARFLKRVGG